MRFFALCATALAAVAAAMPQDSYADTTSVSKVTMTRTVLRVVETVTATRNGTLSSYESTSSETIIVPTGYPSASGHLPAYSNGTSTVLGHSAIPSTSASVSKTGPSTPVSTGAAGKFGVEALSLAALAGLVGLAVF